MAEQKAKLNYLKIAPRKMRQVADTLKGLPVQEAEAQLLMRRRRASKALLKLLRSAIVNAQNNQKLDKSKLFVSSLRVDQGPMLKRFLPRAMGRATPIQKKMSHVTLVLREAEKPFLKRFDIVPPPKKGKKEEKAKKLKKEEKIKKEEKEILKKPEKVGFFKKFFRRKSV